MNLPKFKYCLFFVILIILQSCPNNPTEKNQDSEKVTASITQKDTDQNKGPVHTDPIIDKIKIMVIPCSNDYDFGTNGIELTPYIEEALKQSDSIEVVPFPFKEMKGTGYFGVYDKRYCKPILDKVHADYLIMSELRGNPEGRFKSDSSWGYGTKILNTKTMIQVSSIQADHLSKYEDIGKSVQRNINNLVADLEKTK